MSGWELDVREVLAVLLVLPLVVVIVFALIDIVRRRDLGLVRKAVYVALVVFVLPATLLYLLSRPTSVVRHRERPVDDWRDELLTRLEQRPGGPPVLGPRQEQLLAARVDELRPQPTADRAGTVPTRRVPGTNPPRT